MHPYQLQLRDDLSARRRALDRRLREIEEGVASRALARENGIHSVRGAPVRWLSVQELADFVAESERELGLVEAALRRLADRTFDVCIHCGTGIGERVLKRYPHAVSCEGCAQGYELGYFDKIRGQHGDLRKLFVAVGSCARAAGEEGAGPERSDAARVTLRILRRELAEHFALEERSGHMEKAIRAAPRFHRRASSLLGEHGRFLERLDEINRRAGAAHWRSVVGLLDELVEELRRHERAENEILSRAVLDDVGGGD